MTVHRLRPTVFATPIPTGVHVRGWASSFTVEGGAGLWRVWSALAGQLAVGVPGDQLAAPAGLPPEVRRAIEGLIDQLRAHDLLVEVPEHWGDPDVPGLPPTGVAAWLEAVAESPDAAWSRLRDVVVGVAGTGPVADAARRALRNAGLHSVDEPSRQPSHDVRLLAREQGSGTAVAAVAAGCGDEVAFVTPVTDPDRLPVDIAELTDRLRLVPVADPPVPLAALVGGAAVHRLLAAVGGLPEPAEESTTGNDPTDGASGPLHPAVLVARIDPLRATYHPWLGGDDPAPVGTEAAGRAREDRLTSTGAGDPDLVGALRQLDVLCDPELGLLPPPNPADLPQLPAALARTGDVLGVGVTADAARLDAGLRAVERLLGDGSVVVGTDARHATGVALRRAVNARLDSLTGADVTDATWAGSPAARRWWKALTLRFGVDASVRVRRLAPTAVHAEVVAGDTVLAWAVEATAADAVGLAALAATGVVQARAAGAEVTTGTITLTGASPAWLPADLDVGGWSAPNWHWPAGLADAEDELQRALAPLVTPLPEQSLPDPESLAYQGPLPDLAAPPDLAAVGRTVRRAGFALARVPDGTASRSAHAAEIVAVRS